MGQVNSSVARNTESDQVLGVIIGIGHATREVYVMDPDLMAVSTKPTLMVVPLKYVAISIQAGLLLPFILAV